MSFKSKAALAIATAAAATFTAGIGVATSASAATPSCGHDCIDVFSRMFGTHRTPAFVIDVKQQSAKAGQPIILWRTSNTDPAEDFSAEDSGNVSDFYAAGMVSSALALHYGCTPGTTIAGPNGPIQCSATSTDDPAFEAEYAPYGRDSGFCVGVAATATAKEGVTLQPCGEIGQDDLGGGRERFPVDHQERVRAADQRF